MMNILMLNHNPAGKSTFFRCYHFARQLVKRGHAVTLLTISPTRRLHFARRDEAGVQIVHTPDLAFGFARTGWDPYDVLRRIGWLWGRRYDVVHGFDGRPIVTYPALYAARQGAAFVSDWADWWGRGGVIAEQRPAWLRLSFGGIETYYEEHFRRRAAQLTVISRALEQRAIGLGLASERITRIPSGADVDGIVPRDKQQARRELGLPDARYVAFTGFVQYDVDLLLQSFALLARDWEGALPVRLLLVGPPAAKVQRAAGELGIADLVHAPGPQPFTRMQLYLGAADVLALPLRDSVSNRGRWPNKIGDYMAAARPTVSNPTGEIAHLFAAHEIGLLAGEQPAAFAAALRRLLDDDALAARLGQQARAVAERDYSWAALTPRLEAVYHRAIEQKKNRLVEAGPTLAFYPAGHNEVMR